MKQIRRSVFETNSSSSHSITITKWEPPKEVNIPRNLKKPFLVSEMGQVDDNERAVHDDEVSKLRFIINMIAGAYEELTWSEKTEEYAETFRKLSFEGLIEHDLFVLLKEVVKEETGTTIEFAKPHRDYFPYFEEAYNEDKYVKDLLDVEIEGNTLNKEKFKARIKEIIFNKEIIIKDVDESY